MGVRYVTREAVKAALDAKETARINRRVDDCIDAATSQVNGLTHRDFAPLLETRYFDWPNSAQRGTPPWRLWIETDDLISIMTLTVDGVEIAASDYFLRRADDLNEPPYSYIEIDLASSAAFGSGATHQRMIGVLGLWGWDNRTTAAGALESAISSTSTTTVDVTNAAGVGVGSLLLIESERLTVAGRSMLDTAQNLGGNLTTNVNDVTVPVTTGTAYAEDEMIMIDAEKMLIVEVAGNNLIVKRAWDGSPAAAHSTGADIYAPRRLTVERGVLGTAAATHADATAVRAQVFPGLIRELSLAYAQKVLLQGQAGQARVVGSGDNQRQASGRPVEDIEQDVLRAYGRKSRIAAV